MSFDFTARGEYRAPPLSSGHGNRPSTRTPAPGPGRAGKKMTDEAKDAGYAAQLSAKVRSQAGELEALRGELAELRAYKKDREAADFEQVESIATLRADLERSMRDREAASLAQSRTEGVIDQLVRDRDVLRQQLDEALAARDAALAAVEEERAHRARERATATADGDLQFRQREGQLVAERDASRRALSEARGELAALLRAARASRGSELRALGDVGTEHDAPLAAIVAGVRDWVAAGWVAAASLGTELRGLETDMCVVATDSKVLVNLLQNEVADAKAGRAEADAHRAQLADHVAELKAREQQAAGWEQRALKAEAEAQRATLRAGNLTAELAAMADSQRAAEEKLSLAAASTEAQRRAYVEALRTRAGETGRIPAARAPAPAADDRVLTLCCAQLLRAVHDATLALGGRVPAPVEDPGPAPRPSPEGVAIATRELRAAVRAVQRRWTLAGRAKATADAEVASRTAASVRTVAAGGPPLGYAQAMTKQPSGVGSRPGVPMSPASSLAESFADRHEGAAVVGSFTSPRSMGCSASFATSALGVGAARDGEHLR